MKTIPAALVGLTTAALLALPSAASAVAPADLTVADLSPASMQQAVARHHTSIRFLDSAHFRVAGSTAVIHGQVIGSVDGHQGALAGVPVKLYRQLDGNSTWVYLGSRVTDQGAYPAFSFSTEARQNAHYKAVFAGNDSFTTSQGVRGLAVYRSFNGAITDGSNTATLHGHVSPYYTGKAISLQKRSCASCNYVTVKRTVTGSGGAYSFGLPAPNAGRWWWRLTIPGTPAYIASYGGTFTTEER